MSFPDRDKYWTEVKSFLAEHAQPLDSILAPNEFLEFFPGNYPYNISNLLPAEHFKFVVFHKGMTTEIAIPLRQKVLNSFHVVFANDVFVIYALTPLNVRAVEPAHVKALLEQFDEDIKDRTLNKPISYGAVITTYNRPHCLARSLPQILALGIPVIVIDDASISENQLENQRITQQYRVPLIHLPENRGLPNAMNVGLSYWLADPDIDWIAYFQDDVDVHPDTLKALAQIQDPIVRPILTGRDALEHATFGTGKIAGYNILSKKSMPGVHLHAHRDYWLGVMPIPTPYLGAPKHDKGKPGQGADEDWWITAWSPKSITKQGGYVTCVPGLVETFCLTAQTSSWGNPNE